MDLLPHGKEQAGEEGKAMKQRINPVLPPPRRLLNPVDALLTARSPAQVRLHFARYKRALLYEWERDPKYQGAKGSKWIGTGDDAGKAPRYQQSKPGAGRGGKKEGSGAASKKEGAGKAPAAKAAGGKPQKDAHADIVQHLRDVLSGEGEEADALFAKLQDRLQGMSPAERKEAAEKLGAVLGGKKPAAKKEPKVKPEPKKPASRQQLSEASTFDATKEAWTKLNREGNVKIPELFDAVAEQIPGLTRPQFDKMLLQWKADDLITLQVMNMRDAEPRGNEGIEGQKGSYFYVQLNGDPQDLKLPPGRAMAKAPATKTPAQPKAPAKKKPQKGDINEKGLVFDGRFWRRPPQDKPEPKPRTKKAPAEKKEPAAKPAGGNANDLAQRAKRLYDAAPSSTTREDVDALVGDLGGLKKGDLTRIVSEMGFRPNPKLSNAALAKYIGDLIMQRQGATTRAIKMDRVPSGGFDLALAEAAYANDLNEDKAPVPGSPVHEPPRLPEPPKRSGDDVVSDVMRHYDLATDPSMTVEKLQASVDNLERANLPVAQIRELAQELGIYRSLPNKIEYLKAIRRKVLGRKGSYGRVDA